MQLLAYSEFRLKSEAIPKYDYKGLIPTERRRKFEMLLKKQKCACVPGSIRNLRPLVEYSNYSFFERSSVQVTFNFLHY